MKRNGKEKVGRQGLREERNENKLGRERRGSDTEESDIQSERGRKYKWAGGKNGDWRYYVLQQQSTVTCDFGFGSQITEDTFFWTKKPLN